MAISGLQVKDFRLKNLYLLLSVKVANFDFDLVNLSFCYSTLPIPFPSPISQPCISLFYFILFLNFTILYYFCQISKWIRHRYTCVPHPEPSFLLPPHTLPLGCPSAPAPSIQYCAFLKENSTFLLLNPGL